MSDLSKLCNERSVTRLAAIRIESRSGSDSSQWGRDASHWIVTIGFEGRKESFEFSQGSAHKKPPEAADVIACLCTDARLASDTFEDFCSDLGYDEDSRKALDMYLACQKNGKRVRKLLGAAFEDFANAEH